MINTSWLTISEVNTRFANLGLPEQWMNESNPKLRDKYFKRFSKLRSRIYKEHLATLTKLERKNIKSNNHPSLSHARGEEARLIANKLKVTLIEHGINFVLEVKIGFYHCDRIIFLILVDNSVEQIEAESKLPFYFHGFETRCRQES